MYSRKIAEECVSQNIQSGAQWVILNTHLDSLYQKSIHHQHHQENHMTSLLEGFIPSDWRFKKGSAFKPVSNTFEGEWNSILYNTEKKIVELLCKESEKTVFWFLKWKQKWYKRNLRRS